MFGLSSIENSTSMSFIESNNLGEAFESIQSSRILVNRFRISKSISFIESCFSLDGLFE